MNRLLTIFLLLSVNCFISSAQISDWSTSVAAIIYNNCSTCHHEGGIAPFPLMSYDDAVNNAFTIQADINSHKMPPWPADPNYAHFKDERVLADDEIAAINNWVDNGMPSGDLALAPLSPEFNGEVLLPLIDDTVFVPHYTLPSDLDDYRSFVIHSGYSETKYLNQLQFLPGDPSSVHHAFIYQDTSDISWQTDEDTPEPGFYSSDMGGFSEYAVLFAGYIPGTDPIKFPPNWGMKVPANADYCLSFHYGPGNYGHTDSSKMYVKYCEMPDSLIRSVRNERLLWWYGSSLLNPPFKIQKNTVKTFYEESPEFLTPQSIVAMQPHMHLIGKSFEVFLVNSPGDTTNLLYIPSWDWNWQLNYFVTKLIKIPAGGRVYGTGVYDNTSNNPNNPNDPPVTVFAGEGTEDEMMSVRFSLMDYQEGDEDYILDSSFYGFPTQAVITPYDLGIKIFPNPSHDLLRFSAWLPDHEVNWMLTDITGLIVQSGQEEGIRNGSYTKELNVAAFPSGIYFLTIHSGSERALRKVVIEN